MGRWPSTKPRRLWQALLDIGWKHDPPEGSKPDGSHRKLKRDGWPDYTFAFHDGEEIGPVMMAKVAKKTGLTPDDL